MTDKDLSWEALEVYRILRNKPGTSYQEADDTNKAVIRDWVRSLMQTTEVRITFLKADGAAREMRCTLDWARIPENKQPGQPTVDGIVRESKQKSNEHTLRVFDLDLQEWRSFRFDRLQKIGAEISLEAK